MTSIGNYEVLGVIGDGGMGTVYKARDARFDRFVAIKVLHPQLQRDPGIVERFKTEAVVQAKLQHPHIVRVYDFVADADTLAIVMEHVDGEPLDELIRRQDGPMPLDRVLPVMSQVLGAMAYAHERGLVHRDLKPSNILVADVRGEPFAHVTDFGIAKVLGGEKLRTATGARMGTLSYMSPEHLRSPKQVDARSDIYALGIVLYEMVTGRVPFEGDTEFEVMTRIVEAPVPRPSRVITSLPEALDPIVAKATAKRPDERFATCDAMSLALSAGGNVPRRPGHGPVAGAEVCPKCGVTMHLGDWPYCPHRAGVVSPGPGADRFRPPTKRPSWVVDNRVPDGPPESTSTLSPMESCSDQDVQRPSPVRSRSAWAQWFLGATAAIGALALVAILFRSGGLFQFANTVGPFAAIGTPITFLMWLHRAYRNTGLLPAPPEQDGSLFAEIRSLEHTPWTVVLSFAIPFLNLYRPYLAVIEMRTHTRPIEDPRTVLVTWWWGSFLGVNVVSSLLLIGVLPQNLSVAVIAILVRIGAAIVALAMVRSVSHDIEAKWDDVAPKP